MIIFSTTIIKPITINITNYANSFVHINDRKTTNPKFKNHHKMPTNCSIFHETKIPQQKSYGGVDFPAVLSPAGGPSALKAAVKEQKPWLDSLLHKHGAILFRGFDSLATASDFNEVVEAFGYDELPYVGGAAPRTNIVGRVFTSNESPPDQKIPFHHEMAQVLNTVCIR